MQAAGLEDCGLVYVNVYIYQIIWNCTLKIDVFSWKFYINIADSKILKRNKNYCKKDVDNLKKKSLQLLTPFSLTILWNVCATVLHVWLAYSLSD
jgi:hypothetical protein